MTKALYRLYHTDGCHLCESAEELLKQSACVFESCDIFLQQQWLEQYSTRIPVLQCIATGRELSWPFCASELSFFMESNV